MATSVRTETETVIKRILPYLRRRGYDPEVDIDFETPVINPERYSRGFVDLLVTCGNKTPLFLIEAKRNGKKLTQNDAKQALDYGRVVKVPFVVVTNGQVVQVYNTEMSASIRWNGVPADKVPSRDQVKSVVAFLRRNKTALDAPLGKGDESLPFRPSLPLKQLNDLFSRCHNKIRNIEKNEEHAFADFSKILFLKLLEEKEDLGDFDLPYSYRFWELADRPDAQADQVKAAVLEMLNKIKAKGYGDVLSEDLYLKQPPTFQYIVRELARVSFTDSDHDVKGTAFEYFVRATLKGKKLGQYFTPRQVVQVMVDLMGPDTVINSLLSGNDVRVVDPACGTGGFLVYLLKDSLSQLDRMLAKRKITKATRDNLAAKLMSEVFHGGDANDGVASAAKMNMIIAGDGHNNIRCQNSVLPDASLWPIGQQIYDLVLTNPPFGTNEGDSVPREALSSYPVPSDKGQYLFLQRMVLATKPGGLICTVIDEGLLNTDSGANLRRWVMQHARIRAVLQLPEVTFKPNKINVRSSVLLLERRSEEDVDLTEQYDITFGEVKSLGYHGTGELIRGFDFGAVRASLRDGFLDTSRGRNRSGEAWSSFDIKSTDVASDSTIRWDRKYWDPTVRELLDGLIRGDAQLIGDLNLIPTKRGKSPVSSLYVDEPEGYAVVVKAGSNVTRFGNVTLQGADWIEKQVFDELPDDAKLRSGDVLISSTGDGTLGKAAVWDQEINAVADGHVTIVRVNPNDFDPYYLADYLRCGFGQSQIQRLYTGSTGLIELTPDHVNSIAIARLSGVKQQSEYSVTLRTAEGMYEESLGSAHASLSAARDQFAAQSSHQTG